jgi:hypothetical protein
MRRILFAGVAAVGALAIPSAVLVASSAPASAGSPIVCKKIKGNESSTVTISKCKGIPKADKKLYKSATGTSTVLAGGGDINWIPVGTTSTLSTPTVTLGGSGCPAADTRVIATGTIVGGTAAITSPGDPYSGTFCVAPSGAISLQKGTSMSL